MPNKVLNVSTIPTSFAFAHSLAKGLWNKAEKDPFKLSSMQIYLPTRRACRSMRTAFLQVTQGQALLLPRMTPLGDMDEDDFSFASAEAAFDVPPAISPLRRQLLLIKLIRKKDSTLPIEQVVDLAKALAKLQDEVDVEKVSFNDLQKLVPDVQNLAMHWQETLQFLEIVTALWPQVLLEEGGVLNPAERRNLLLEKQAELWQKMPPATPVIAAGSTGSIPAVGDWMKVLAATPQGSVVLPGLDLELDEEAWQDMPESHPQWGMKKLLTTFEMRRKDVLVWSYLDKTETNLVKEKRVRLLQESMRPASTTQKWRFLTKDDVPDLATQGLELCDLENAQTEAEVVALRLRAHLEEPEKTAMVVTPDRSLAERIGLALERWKIDVNDSAGTSLLRTNLGSFLVSLQNASRPAASAIDYLTLFKHPLAGCGVSTHLCRQRARFMEQHVWRGLRRSDGLKGAADFLRIRDADVAAWFDEVANLFVETTQNWFIKEPFLTKVDRHIQLAEAVAKTDEKQGAERLWREMAGETAVTFLHDLREAAHDFDEVDGDEYQNLFQSLLATISFHKPYSTHARIQILGPLEARLQQADLVILAGLNEGTWPPQIEQDPWLSRPMQKQFGLPLPEQRLGITAHDFVQLAASEKVLLTRAKKDGGAPTVPSRYLLQLDAVLRASNGGAIHQNFLRTNLPWLEWAAALDKPTSKIMAITPPEPRPPLAFRPKKLSVTEIGAWIHNPYEIYAKRILKLRKLDPVDAELSPADFGNILHKILEVFLRAYPHDLPQNALEEMHIIADDVFKPYEAWPQIACFWKPRFQRIAVWFLDMLQRQRAEGVEILGVELKGQFTLPELDFTLYGRADRLDKTAEGSLIVIDYKTAVPPSNKDVASGSEPQLPLLGLMVQNAGFDQCPSGTVKAIGFWHLSGTAEIGKQHIIEDHCDIIIQNASARLEDMVRQFSDVSTPYLAAPNASRQPKFNDYAHLSRLAEWRLAGGSE